MRERELRRGGLGGREVPFNASGLIGVTLRFNDAAVLRMA